MPVSGGDKVKLNDEASDIGLIGWTPDSRSILLTSDRSVSQSLYRIGVNQGMPTR